MRLALQSQGSEKSQPSPPRPKGEPENTYYRIVTIPVPDDLVPEVGGLDVAPGGALFACTRRGDLFRIDGAHADPPM